MLRDSDLARLKLHLLPAVDLREPLENSGFLPLKEYLTSRGKPMNEYKKNLMSKSINHTYDTPNEWPLR